MRLKVSAGPPLVATLHEVEQPPDAGDHRQRRSSRRGGDDRSAGRGTDRTRPNPRPRLRFAGHQHEATNALGGQRTRKRDAARETPALASTTAAGALRTEPTSRTGRARVTQSNRAGMIHDLLGVPDRTELHHENHVAVHPLLPRAARERGRGGTWIRRAGGDGARMQTLAVGCWRDRVLHEWVRTTRLAWKRDAPASAAEAIAESRQWLARGRAAAPVDGADVVERSPQHLEGRQAETTSARRRSRASVSRAQRRRPDAVRPRERRRVRRRRRRRHSVVVDIIHAAEYVWKTPPVFHRTTGVIEGDAPVILELRALRASGDSIRTGTPTKPASTSGTTHSATLTG